MPNILLFVERAANSIGMRLRDRRRLCRLKWTCGRNLSVGHIDSLELFDLLTRDGVTPKVIFDVGANRGTWTLLAKAIWPEARVVAFEPLQECVRHFETVTDILENVYLFDVGLSEQSGEVMLHIASNLDSSSIFDACRRHEEIFGIGMVGAEIVRVRRAEEIIDDGNVPLPELVKLDIQGAELVAMKGFGRFFGMIPYWIVELSFVPLYQGGCLAGEVIAYFERAGFYMRSIAPTLFRAGSELVQCDALFCRRNESAAATTR